MPHKAGAMITIHPETRERVHEYRKVLKLKTLDATIRYMLDALPDLAQTVEQARVQALDESQIEGMMAGLMVGASLAPASTMKGPALKRWRANLAEARRRVAGTGKGSK